MKSFDAWADDLAQKIATKDEKPCAICNGDGEHMGMVCYGGPPIEVKVYCIECAGARAGERVDHG